MVVEGKKQAEWRRGSLRDDVRMRLAAAHGNVVRSREGRGLEDRWKTK